MQQEGPTEPLIRRCRHDASNWHLFPQLTLQDTPTSARSSKRGTWLFLLACQVALAGGVKRPSISAMTAKANAAVPASSQRRGTNDQQRVKPSSATARSGQATPAIGRRGQNAEHLPRHTAKPKSKFAGHPSECPRQPVARADAQRPSVTFVPHEVHTKIQYVHAQTQGTSVETRPRSPIPCKRQRSRDSHRKNPTSRMSA